MTGSSARAARVLALTSTRGPSARAAPPGELADAAELLALAAHLERDELGLCELRIAYATNQLNGGGEMAPPREGKAAALDGNGLPLDPAAQYVAAEPLLTLADRGEEVAVLPGNRRLGSSPLVRASPGSWYREGDEAPAPRRRPARA